MVFETLIPNQEIYVQIGRFLFVLGLGIFITRFGALPVVSKLLERRDSSKKARHQIKNLTTIVLVFITLATALQAGEFGNLVTVIGTIAAALTVAIGFGMREEVGNLVAGVFIYINNPFVKGDYIQVGEDEGEVKEISLRSTTLNGHASETISVPNNKVSSNHVKNYTKGIKTKSSIEFKLKPSIAKQAAEIIERRAKEADEVLDSPEPSILFRKFDEDKIVFELRYWVRDSADSKSIKSSILQEFNDEAAKQELFKEEDEEKEDK
jgi:small conductance mechanosensitive channel